MSTTVIEEIRLSRAFAVAFYEALQNAKVEVPQDVLDRFNTLKQFYDYQMTRELS